MYVRCPPTYCKAIHSIHLVPLWHKCLVKRRLRFHGGHHMGIKWLFPVEPNMAMSTAGPVGPVMPLLPVKGQWTSCFLIYRLKATCPERPSVRPVALEVDKYNATKLPGKCFKSRATLLYLHGRTRHTECNINSHRVWGG